LILAACGGGDDDSDSAAPDAVSTEAPAETESAPEAASLEAEGAAPEEAAAAEATPAAPGAAPATPTAAAAPAKGPGGAAQARSSAAKPAAKSSGGAEPAKGAAPAGAQPGAPAPGAAPAAPTPGAPAAGGEAAPGKLGASDVGVSATEIKTGGVNMHGMPLGNLLIDPQVRAMNASASAINDAGGILGRKLKYIDCDDGPGETARAKACLKKLIEQDKIFSLLTSTTWSSSAFSDDLARYKIPLVGAWAYTHTEWGDPWSFATHTSMLHEANAGAEWVAQVIKPKTFGLICLNAPEMQKSCENVTRVLEKTGAKMVKKIDVTLTPGDLSAEVVAMRAADPDHVIHYVINPASIAKFIVDAAQQQYWPPLGLSGNHMATEIMGEIFGEWPVNRYWTNTTYKLWGSDFIATIAKYAPNNLGLNHHVSQAGFVGTNVFAQAAREVGPDLTRDKLMKVLNTPDRVWDAGPGLGQTMSWAPGYRELDGAPGKGKDTMARFEYMYKYTDVNTKTEWDSTPRGFSPDPDMFEIRDTQSCCYK
jgi:ABC-type branched-subunit amino acid transport system substrate-binding protein